MTLSACKRTDFQLSAFPVIFTHACEFVILPEANIKVIVFWEVTPCCMDDRRPL